MSSRVLSDTELARLRDVSRRIRLDAVGMVHRSKSAHLGSALSMTDILAVLYFRFLKIDPANPDREDRDRFILSKGHGGSGLYATLAERGFFPVEDLQTYGTDGSRFAVHPSSMMVKGIEASTGALGHGLPIGAGMALAAKRDEKKHRVVVMVSDGECDEGSTWEAAMAAGHWGLHNLICIVDYNKIQSFGTVKEVMDLEPFADKWKSFRWETIEVDGHDHEAIAAALDRCPLDAAKPTCIIAHTIKGKGARWMENTVESHYLSPSADHWKMACEDLSSDHA